MAFFFIGKASVLQSTPASFAILHQFHVQSQQNSSQIEGKCSSEIKCTQVDER